MKHDLKIWPEFFDAVENGTKKFELRKNDRDFQVGDTLQLREWDPEKKDYTGRIVTVRVTYMLLEATPFGLAQGHVVMSIERHGQRIA